MQKDTELVRLKREITVLREQIYDNEAEADDMLGDNAIWEDQIEELESEIEDIQSCSMEILVKGMIAGSEYGIIRDPSMIARFAVTGWTTLIFMFATNVVYGCQERYPHKDSWCEMLGICDEICEKGEENMQEENYDSQVEEREHSIGNLERGVNQLCELKQKLEQLEKKLDVVLIPEPKAVPGGEEPESGDRPCSTLLLRTREVNSHIRLCIDQINELMDRVDL